MAWLLVISPAAAAEEIKPPFFGINGLAYLHYRDARDATRTAELRVNLIKQAGCVADRCDFWWSIVEPKPGVWNWEKTDWMVDFLTKRHIEVFPILSYTAAWMKDSPQSGPEIAGFANYVFESVSRYKDRVRCWEVWNEPNIETFWKPAPDVDVYSRLLEASYKAAKRADPDCTIVGSVTSMTDLNWIINLARRGGLNHMDALSFHPYALADGPGEMDFHRQIRNVRRVLAEHGKEAMPLWITEMGWQADASREPEVDKQSRYIIMAHVIAAAEGIERLFWFNLQDWYESGKLIGWGLMAPDFQVKRSAGSYSLVRQKLLRARFEGYLPLRNGVAYVFRKANRPMLVAWAYRNHETSISLPASADVTLMYGNVLKSQKGDLRVSPDPVFVEFHDSVYIGGIRPDLPPKENLLVNASFEECESTTRPFGWDRGYFYGGGDRGSYEVRTQDAADGIVAVGFAGAEDAVWQSWPVPAVPGEKYELTAKMKTVDARGENRVQINYLGGAGWASMGTDSSDSVKGTTDGWRTVSVSGVVPGDACAVRVNLASKGSAGRVLFDDLNLTRKDTDAIK
jgi:hypothetical protein